MIKTYQKSRSCLVCGKQTVTGHNVSHSQKKTKRKLHPNIVVSLDFMKKKHQGICAKCYKSQTKKTKRT